MKFYKNFLNLSFLFWILFLFVIAVIAWSILFELDKSIVASGQVSPAGRSVKVQNAYQGVISDIFIEVGDEVNTLEPLIKLNTSRELQKLSFLKKREKAIKYEMARLLSLLGQPGGLENIAPNQDRYYKIQSNISENEKLVFLGQLNSLDTQIEASKTNLTLLNSRLPIIEKQIKLAETKLNLVNKMQEAGYEGEINVLMMEAEYNDALDKYVTLRNEIKLHENEIKQLENEITKLHNDRSVTAAVQHFELSKELDQVYAEINELELFINESSITAPISGSISRLLYENIGQVIEPGTTLAEIIPADTENVFYVEIPISSISEVNIGQNGKVSLANMDLRQNQHLSGVLTKLDGDVTVTDDGRKFYSGILEFDDTSSNFLLPGVAGTVSLELGKRSVFMYLFDPIFSVVLNSLKE